MLALVAFKVELSASRLEACSWDAKHCGGDGLGGRRG